MRSKSRTPWTIFVPWGSIFGPLHSSEIHSIIVSRLAAVAIVSDDSFRFLTVHLFPLAPAVTQLVPLPRMTESMEEGEQ